MRTEMKMVMMMRVAVVVLVHERRHEHSTTENFFSNDTRRNKTIVDGDVRLDHAATHAVRSPSCQG